MLSFQAVVILSRVYQTNKSDDILRTLGTDASSTLPPGKYQRGLDDCLSVGVLLNHETLATRQCHPAHLKWNGSGTSDWHASSRATESVSTSVDQCVLIRRLLSYPAFTGWTLSIVARNTPGSPTSQMFGSIDTPVIRTRKCGRMPKSPRLPKCQRAPRHRSSWSSNQAPPSLLIFMRPAGGRKLRAGEVDRGNQRRISPGKAFQHGHIVVKHHNEDPSVIKIYHLPRL